MLINGKIIAAGIIAKLKEDIKRHKNFLSDGRPRLLPALAKNFGTMAAVLVGDDPAQLSFLKRKAAVAKELGLKFDLQKFPTDTSEANLTKELARISQNPNVGGVIVQLPLPAHIGTARVLDTIPASKDVDCLTEENLGKFCTGQYLIAPPAVGALESILSAINFGDMKTKNAVVLGYGLLVGQPIVHWLSRRAASTSIVRKATPEDFKRRILQEADLIVCGANEANALPTSAINMGAVVIDFGFPPNADFKALDELGRKVTPTPGGTGPVLVAELFRNYFKLNI